MNETKECIDCGEVKVVSPDPKVSEFNLTAGTSEKKKRYRSHCRDCHHESRNAKRHFCTIEMLNGDIEDWVHSHHRKGFEKKGGVVIDDWHQERPGDKWPTRKELIAMDIPKDRKDCIECEKALIPGEDWSKSYQEGKVYLHTLCHGKRDRVQQRACDRLGLTNKKSYKQGGLENDWLSLSKEEKKIALTEQRQIDKDNGVDQSTGHNVLADLPKKGPKIILPKIILDPGQKLFRESQKGVFKPGDMPKKRASRSGKTVDEINEQPSWDYLIWAHDPDNGYDRDTCKVGNSQEEDAVKYLLTRYLECISPSHPLRGLQTFDLIFRLLKNGRVAEDQAIIRMEAASAYRIPGTRESFLFPGSVDPNSKSRDLARDTFKECMLDHGGVLHFDRVIFEESRGERFV